jgi:hypothetical protein
MHQLAESAFICSIRHRLAKARRGPAAKLAERSHLRLITILRRKLFTADRTKAALQRDDPVQAKLTHREI